MFVRSIGGAADLSAAEIIRAKLLLGSLPKDDAIKTWGGRCSGRTCAGCGGRIDGGVEYESEFADGRSLQFHVRCFMLWNAARRDL
jgi:hypothetical protein